MWTYLDTLICSSPTDLYSDKKIPVLKTDIHYYILITKEGIRKH